MGLKALYACAATAALTITVASAVADDDLGTTGPSLAILSSADLGPPPTTKDAPPMPPVTAAVEVHTTYTHWPAAAEPGVPDDPPDVQPRADDPVTDPAPVIPAPVSSTPPKRLVRCRPQTIYDPWHRFRPRHPWRITLEGSIALIDGPTGSLGEPVPAGAAALDWGRISMDPAYGGRATVSYAFTPWDRVEVRGAWWSATQGDSNQTGVFGFAPPAGGVSLPSSATLETEDELLSAEGTWWWDLGRREAVAFSAGAGARYVNLVETSRVKDWTPPLGFGPPVLRARAENDFLAAQIAGAVRWQASRRVELGITLKALVGVLSRDVAIQDASLLAGGAHRTARDGSDLGWGAEIEVSALWRMSRRVGITASYGLLYLGEVARAHEAMDFSQANTGAVQTRSATGDLIAHLFFMGLDLRL